MDKSWINSKERTSVEYMQGIIKFISFAYEKCAPNDQILCPCRKCINAFWRSKDDVIEHLLCSGFQKNYIQWTYHGEVSNPSTSNANDNDTHFGNDIPILLKDAFYQVGMGGEDNADVEDCNDHVEDDLNASTIKDKSYSRMDKESEKISELMRNANKPLYDNCNESKLAAVLYLYHLKCLNGWSNSSFTQLLDYLSFLLPEGNNLPKSHHEVKSMVSSLGLSYEKIHACRNGCMLFWKNNENVELCSICGESRWKGSRSDDDDLLVDCTVIKQRRKPMNVLRWFPLKPRLQRLFMCSKTSGDMRWHETSIKDGLLRHPVDSLAWKEFDLKHPCFAREPRNIRLGLAADGLNPFKNMNVSHSTWPIILIPYNLPPWICMKQTNFILSLLIPGPKAPGDKIDIYLQPLIDELKELWDSGIETFDASTNESFTMRAALLWTLNDFPAYGSLSGWSVRGEKACPVCGQYTDSRWLTHSRKYCYMGHRRWLNPNHNFRTDDASFDGKIEERLAPARTSGSTILQASQVLVDGSHWPLKRLPSFFELPYWKDNLLRHNIDFMHTEKNVFDNIFGTLTCHAKKTKDTCKAREDLVAIGIRSELHPRLEREGTNKIMPRACYEMTKKEVEVLLITLKNIKLPDELSCNIARGVQPKQRKIVGMKTYDCHILMQELLPVVIRGLLPDKVTLLTIGTCHFFKCLCAKVLDPSDLDILQSRAIVILCEMEKLYPPSFFTIMIHLIIHLAEEAKLGGPVCYRWMYPIERYFLTLKGFVKNKAHPEGSIAEGYLASECLTFCSRYLHGGQTKFNRSLRNDKDIIPMEDEALPPPLGRPLGKKKRNMQFNVKKRKRNFRTTLDGHSIFQAHRYILFNEVEVNQFRNEHKALLRRRHRSPRLSQYELDKLHSIHFNDWFRDKVADMESQGSESISEKLKWLARGPDSVARTYRGYIVNGFRFHTKDAENNLTTQNSGVAVISSSTHYSKKNDRQPVEGEYNFYGVLKEILKLNYSGMYSIVLFKCDWIDQIKGCKTDEYGFTIVNFSHLSHTGKDITDDPYIIASQASKVFYIVDNKNEGWHVVKRVKVRDAYDFMDTQTLQSLQYSLDASLAANESSSWLRKDVDDLEIHITPEMENEQSDEEANDDS